MYNYVNNDNNNNITINNIYIYIHHHISTTNPIICPSFLEPAFCETAAGPSSRRWKSIRWRICRRSFWWRRRFPWPPSMTWPRWGDGLSHGLIMAMYTYIYIHIYTYIYIYIYYRGKPKTDSNYDLRTYIWGGFGPFPIFLGEIWHIKGPICLLNIFCHRAPGNLGKDMGWLRTHLGMGQRYSKIISPPGFQC